MTWAHRVAGHVGGERIVAAWELLLGFPDGRSAAFECSKRNDDCKAVCRAIAAGAGERIVMVADDGDFADWQRDWPADNGRG